MIDADRIDDLLPQTQCTQCGFDGCRPYAEAIARGEADINRCPPGGAAGIVRLASLLDRVPTPLDPACGVERPERVAVIDEIACIGCTLCLQACPVDAIVGAGKRMHTVILDECTGCDRCLPPCPVDCIEMLTVADARAAGFQVAEKPASAWQARARRARARHESRVARLAREKSEREARLVAKAERKLESLPAADPDGERKRAVIEAAIARARARRSALGES